MRRVEPWILALLWAAAWAAPPTRPDWIAWVGDLLAGRWTDTDPWAVALFQAMGLWPWLMASLLADELRGAGAPRGWRDRVPAWPFLVLSNVGGMFVLGVYAAARPVERPPMPEAPWLRWVGGTTLPGVVFALALTLTAWAAWTGAPGVALHAIRTEGFMWTMSWDFCAFWATSLVWLHRRLGWRHAGWIPVLGTAAAAWQVARSRR